MNWLILLFALEIGYAPSYGSLNVLPDITVNEDVSTNIGYVMLEARIEIMKIFLFNHQ